jgi:hypothetical protein
VNSSQDDGLARAGNWSESPFVTEAVLVGADLALMYYLMGLGIGPERALGLVRAVESGLDLDADGNLFQDVEIDAAG